MRFRKKPVVIEAVLTADVIRWASSEWVSIPQWLKDAYETGGVILCPDYISVRTLEGTMRAEKTDWIIRGVKGELYPCKPDIFAATYEAA
jgi:hypothetical protein